MMDERGPTAWERLCQPVDLSKRIEAEPMPPPEDRDRLLELIQRRGAWLKNRPGRAVLLLADEGVTMTEIQVIKVLSAHGKA